MLDKNDQLRQGPQCNHLEASFAIVIVTEGKESEEVDWGWGAAHSPTEKVSSCGGRDRIGQGDAPGDMKQPRAVLSLYERHK